MQDNKNKSHLRDQKERNSLYKENRRNPLGLRFFDNAYGIE